MYLVTCPGCGSATSSAACPNWWNETIRVTCTAKYVSGQGYEKGCGYAQASAEERSQADRLISQWQLRYT